MKTRRPTVYEKIDKKYKREIIIKITHIHGKQKYNKYKSLGV